MNNQDKKAGNRMPFRKNNPTSNLDWLLNSLSELLEHFHYFSYH